MKRVKTHGIKGKMMDTGEHFCVLWLDLGCQLAALGWRCGLRKKDMSRKLWKHDVAEVKI